MSRKTTFAGLTELDPGDSLLDDGGAFVGKDRETIDYYLQIGAKTHRHTGLDGLDNPTSAPSAAVVASGGTIDPELSMAIGYTLQDAARGETILSPTVTVSTGGPLDPPENSITATMDYSPSGALGVDDYYYGITYVDASGGETPLGPTEQVTREPGHTYARVLLTGLNTNLATASATGWKLYRARGGGDFAYLAAGTGSAYTDDGTVSPICDAQPPNDNFNTTNSINTLVLTLPPSNAVGDASYINVYLSQSGNFVGSVFLDQFPVSSAGASVVYRSLTLDDQQPPSVSTSIGTANQIDPDTEFIDFHWLRPVHTGGDLPTGELGDVRLVTESGAIMAMLNASGTSSQWTRVGSAVVTGGQGTVKAVEEAGELSVVMSPATLQFVASGGAGVKVSDLGGGSAQILIGQGYVAPGGGGGGGFIEAKDGDTNVYPAPCHDFQASGAASIDVTNLGGGSARVMISTPLVSPMAPSALLDVTDAEGTRVEDIGQLDFRGSGGVGVDVTSLGNGSARVMIGLPPAVIPMAPSALLDVTDEGGTAVRDIGLLDFRASGGASIDVIDLGNGSARVTMAAPSANAIAIENWNEASFGSAWTNATGSGFANTQYRKEGDLVRLRGMAVKPTTQGTPVEGETIFTLPAGYRPPSRVTGQGPGGRVDIQTDGTVIFVGGEYWQGFDQIAFSTVASGGGEIIGSFSPLARRWASATISLASGASGNVDFTGSAAGIRLLKISTSKRTRVRAYGDQTARTADLARAISTDPTGDHGVLLDYAATPNPSGGIYRMAPAVDVHNLDDTVLNKHYLNVTNYDATGNVVVALLFVPTEVV